MSAIEPYWQPQEAARYLRLSASTLAKLRVYGGGPIYYRAGRAIRYRQEDLDHWMATRRHSSTSDVAPHSQGAR